MVEPEEVRHVEFGFKSEPFDGWRVNVTAYETTIQEYQAQVVNQSVGVLRGYLANAGTVARNCAAVRFVEIGK